MKYRCCLLFLAAQIFFGGNATAADDTLNSPENLHWRCWYDQQVHITCLLDTVSEAAAPLEEVFPANLPPIVKVMRTKPASLRDYIIRIPLHTQPYDLEFTVLLAKLTVCGSRRDCTVNFTLNLPFDDEIIALLNRHLPGTDRDANTILAMLGDDLDDVE